jgi:small conductance mechanosensitive channel
LTEFFSQYPGWPRAVAALALAAAVAYLVALVAVSIARAALVGILRGDRAATVASPAVTRPLRVVRVMVFLAVFAALGLPALDAAGLRSTAGMNSEALTRWFFGSGLRIVFVATLTYVAVRIIGISARRLEDAIGGQDAPDMVERIKRARTLSGLVQNALTVMVLGIATLMILRELRLDIMPILTGAGIVGLAVGFGAQTLVKDLIAGFFLTVENQVRVGDVAVINGTGGLVENINLRTIVLRDVEGVVHVFPNGSIERLSNRSKDFSYYVIDLKIAHTEDPDNVIAVLREVGHDLAADERVGANILEPLEVFGVDGFDGADIVIKLRIKTLPLRQWDVGRELRRRIKKTFAARGIDMPTPHLALSFAESSRPFQVEKS